MMRQPLLAILLFTVALPASAQKLQEDRGECAIRINENKTWKGTAAYNVRDGRLRITCYARTGHVSFKVWDPTVPPSALKHAPGPLGSLEIGEDVAFEYCITTFPRRGCMRQRAEYGELYVEFTEEGHVRGEFEAERAFGRSLISGRFDAVQAEER